MDIDGMIDKSFWKDILYEIINSMDPWDIDLSELATRYSRKVEEMREMNFRVPANVVLVSSVLLRMKADIMAAVDINLFEFAPDFEEGLNFGEFDLSAFSEVGGGFDIHEGNGDGEVPLGVRPKRVTKRRVSAIELITAIQEVLEDRKIKERLVKEGVERKPIEIILTKDIKDLIEETYRRVIDILSSKKDSVVRFSELKGKEIIPTFMSLLHLSNDQRVCLSQERIYDEIFISVR